MNGFRIDTYKLAAESKMILLGKGIGRIGQPTRRTDGTGITLDMLDHGMKLIADPKLTRTAMRPEKFQDLNIEKICRTYRALILGVEGTTVEYGENKPSGEIIEILKDLRERISICVMTNNNMRSWAIFDQLYIPVVRNVSPMPDPSAFEVALALYLNKTKNGPTDIHPENCATIGSNFMTEGGCRRAGMDFIMVKPMKGRHEPAPYRFMRAAGEQIASMHDMIRSIRHREISSSEV